MRIVSCEEIESILLVGRSEENRRIDRFQCRCGRSMRLIQGKTNESRVFRRAEEMSNGVRSQIEHLNSVECRIEEKCSRSVELQIDQRIEEFVLLQILLDGQSSRIFDVVEQIDVAFVFFGLKTLMKIFVDLEMFVEDLHDLRGERVEEK